MNTPLLSIDDLHVSFLTRNGAVDALRGVNLELQAGQTLGVVGESGSGKSVTAFSAMQLLERAGRITRGTITYRGVDITRAKGRDLRALHGAQISMIFQNPRAALNPIRTIGLQIADALGAHRSTSASDARRRARDLLEQVLIKDPDRRLGAYPHELSGGMCQRVMIAMAIACEPALLIADEPTTGLDVSTQKSIMDLLAEIVSSRGMGMILITHDLGLAAQYCGNIAVMERGVVVEQGTPRELFGSPKVPYTARLVAASPTRTSRVEDLVPECTAAPIAVRKDRPVSSGRLEQRVDAPLLTVSSLAKEFDRTKAVDRVSFDVRAGESLGLVGESGSGKTTISRLISRLIDPSDGEIIFDQESISAIPARDFNRSPFRKEIQIVFQDSHDSLNPRFTAFELDRPSHTQAPGFAPARCVD